MLCFSFCLSFFFFFPSLTFPFLVAVQNIYISQELTGMEKWSFDFTGEKKKGVKVKGVGLTQLLYSIKCSSGFQVERPQPAQHHSNECY